MIYYGGTQNFGGVPKITTGEPKITLGGHPKSGGEPKKGSQISGATPGQVFGKEGIPNLGSPQFGCPSILGPPSHLGPPQIWDPLNFGSPQIWDPLNLGPLNFWDPLFAPQAKKNSHKISGIFLHSEFKSYCNFALQAKILGVK